MSRCPSPTAAITRVLTGLGLARGARKDFTVIGNNHNPKGPHTGYIAVLNRASSARVVRDNAETIERETAALGFPFTVRATTHYGDVSALVVFKY